jgi:tetratricopeptide (TPR) repeat protein
VLEGSVRESAGRLRVTVQLLDATNGYHLWSETYDRPETELFAMQDEIARSIIAALRIELLPEQLRGLAEHGTTNAEAYKQFLIAHYVFKDDETGNRRALGAYERAVGARSGFHRRVARPRRRARAHGYLRRHRRGGARGQAALARGARPHRGAHARTVPDGYLERGEHRYAHWWDWAGGEADLERAAALGARNTEPTSCARRGYVPRSAGSTNRSRCSRRATELDPGSDTAWTVMGYHLIGQRRFERAAEVLAQAVRNRPIDEHAHYYLGLVELLQGGPRRRSRTSRTARTCCGSPGSRSRTMRSATTRRPERDLELLIERYGHILPYQAAEVYAWRGEPDLAFQWLDRTLEAARRQRDVPEVRPAARFAPEGPAVRGGAREGEPATLKRARVPNGVVRRRADESLNRIRLPRPVQRRFRD